MSEEYIPFPEVYDRRKLNALYREIPLKDSTFRTLRKYFNAMANLYGIIPLEKAWEIIHSQCPRMVTESEFYAFVEIARHECECFCILGEADIYTSLKTNAPSQRDIIDTELLLSDEDLYGLTREHQRGKRYYIPGKQELLRYADPDYYEVTPEIKKLSEFCTGKLKMSEMNVEVFLAEFNYKIRYIDYYPHSWMPEMEDFGVVFFDQKQAEKFLKLYQDAFNSGRMQCNRGATPTEVYDRTPLEQRIPKAINFGPNIRKAIADGSMNADEMRKQIISMKLPNEEVRLDMLRQIAEIETANSPRPISRNAPCPCGSGKKYKRCCGKNLPS